MEPAQSKKLSPTGKNILAITVLSVPLLFLALPGAWMCLVVAVAGLIMFFKVFGVRFFFWLFFLAIAAGIIFSSHALFLLSMIFGGLMLLSWLPDLSSQPADNPDPPRSATPTERLRALEEAHQQNLLTEQEYLEKRQQIIADF